MSAGAAGAGAAVAVMNSSLVLGTMVKLEPDDFELVLSKADEPMVVMSRTGRWRVRYHYLTSYKGLVFRCTTPTPLELPVSTEIIEAKRMVPRI